MEHLGIKQVKALLEEGGFRPNKTLGQNFLVQPQMCEKIVSHLSHDVYDEVLEIGTGLGSLTLFLADSFSKVTTVDVDEKCMDSAKKVLAQNSFTNVDVVKANALRLPEELTHFPVVCGNLPYNIATPIVMTIFETFPNLKLFLVMVQKEVAQRYVARTSSKAYGAVSVKCAYYSDAKMIGDVGKGSFYPQPNVDSSLVLFKVKENQYENKELLFSLVEKAFTHRRKMLRVSFKNEIWFEELSRSNKFEFTKRPQDLLLDDWIELAEEVCRIV